MYRKQDASEVVVKLIFRAIFVTIGLFVFILWLGWKRRQKKDPRQISEESTTIGATFAIIGLIGGLLLVASGENSYDQTQMVIGFILLAGGYVLLLLSISGDFKLPIASLSPQVRQQTTQDDTPANFICTKLEIRVPKTQIWQVETIQQFTDALLLNFWQVMFVIDADEDGIHWQVIVLDDVDVMVNSLRSLVHNSYPDATVNVVEHQAFPYSQAVYQYTAYYEQSNMFIAPMKYIEDMRQADVLRTIVESLNNLDQDERVQYALAMNGIDNKAYDKGQEMVTQSTIHPLQYLSSQGIENAIAKKIHGFDRVEKFVPQDQRVMEDKLRGQIFKAMLAIQVNAPNPQRVLELVIGLDSQMSGFTRMPYNGLSYVQSHSFEDHILFLENEAQASKFDIVKLFDTWLSQTKKADIPPSLSLDTREIAALWHLPHEKVKANRVHWGYKHVLVPHQIARLKEGVCIGQAERGHSTHIDVHLPYEDRVTHISIVGKTRTGKSNLMHHLIHQDIANGKGVAVIDPHGKLVEDILRSSIPPEREQDVVLYDLADKDYPPPFNPLVGTQHQSLLGVIGLIEKLFDGTEQMARLSNTLRATLLLLGEDPNPTMRDAARILVDDVYREQLLQNSSNPEVVDYWDFQYNRASSGFKQQLADPIINRIRPFYGNPYLYPAICNPKGINFRKLINDNKIILISLEADDDFVPKQERDLIGAMLMSRLQMAGMKKYHRSAEPFYIFVDEVQRFSTSSFDTVFSEAGKYNLSLTVAHQYLEQLEGDLMRSILGNSGTSLVFRCSPDDTSRLSLHMQPEFSRHDLTELDRFQAAVKMQVHAQTQPAFTLYPPPPVTIPNDADERVKRIRQISQRHQQSREDVLAWLNEKYNARIIPNNGKIDSNEFVESRDE